MTDRFDLQRFVDAQDRGVYASALEELRRGRKTGHWMWFVFPQIAGLGRSPTAQHYAVSGLDEARAYLEHPLLGARLREVAQALLDGSETDPVGVLGEIDAQKLQSSMTLFHAADPRNPLFPEVLARFYGRERDIATLDLIR